MSKVMDKGKISKTQECIPVGCVPSAAVAISGGGGVCLGGVCPACVKKSVHGGGGDVCPIVCWDTLSSWTEFLTHACEHITFPQQ